MATVPIPKRLSRTALMQAFPRVTQTNWRNMFNYEKNNGLYELRVDGPDSNAYYDVEKIVEWLMERNLYQRCEFKEPGELFYEGPAVNIMQHLMAK